MGHFSEMGVLGCKTPAELLIRSRIVRGVLGTYKTNDTVLRQSAELLLVAEDDETVRWKLEFSGISEISKILCGQKSGLRRFSKNLSDRTLEHA